MPVWAISTHHHPGHEPLQIAIHQPKPRTDDQSSLRLHSALPCSLLRAHASLAVDSCQYGQTPAKRTHSTKATIYDTESHTGSMVCAWSSIPALKSPADRCFGWLSNSCFSRQSSSSSSLPGHFFRSSFVNPFLPSHFFSLTYGQEPSLVRLMLLSALCGWVSACIGCISACTGCIFSACIGCIFSEGVMGGWVSEGVMCEWISMCTARVKVLTEKL